MKLVENGASDDNHGKKATNSNGSGNGNSNHRKKEAAEEFAFRVTQKKYRRRPDDPNYVGDLEDCIDFGRIDGGDDRIERVRIASSSSSSGGKRDGCAGDGLNYYQGPVYRLKEDGFEGFLYCPQALSVRVQEELAYLAVTTYCEKPHSTNIDLIAPKPNEIDNGAGGEQLMMWDIWKEENFVSKEKKSATAASSADTKEASLPQRKAKKKRLYRSFQKLSWATMGYNYDWTARAYHDGDRSPVPSDLEKLAKMFAATSLLYLGGRSSDSESSSASTQFTASACIVNYYNSKSIMGGHRDDSEFAIDKPIVSFSAGRPAVFLLGGPSRNDTPILPILVRPGDVMLMGGNTRLNYHAMARLLPAEIARLPSSTRSGEATSADVKDDRGEPQPGPDQQIQSFTAIQVPECEKGALRAYLAGHRVNINLRQVYPDEEGR